MPRPSPDRPAEAEAPQGSRSSRLGREAAVVLFFAALTLFATRPLACHLRTHVLYGVDPPIYVWTVNWLSGHLLEPGELFEGNLYYPTRHVAVLSDLALGTALLVAPLRPLFPDPVTLCNVGILLTLTFGAWAFYTLVRALTSSTPAGLLAGILAAYGSHQLWHMYQLALVNIGWLALFLLALDRTFRRPAPATAFLLGLTFALNALSSAYFALAAAAMALVFAVLRVRALRSPRILLACTAAAVLAGLLLVPYARAFLWLQATEGVQRSIEMNVDNAFKPARDLTSNAYLYRDWLGKGGERLFPGFLCLLLAGWACLRRVAGGAFYAASALVMVVLSLGPAVELAGRKLDLPYGALFAIPPLNALMHPYSFAGVARLCVAVLAGLAFAPLARRGRWVAAAGIAAALVEVAAPGAGLRAVPPGLPAAYQALDRLPPGPLLEVPLERPDALIWAARHGRPVLNGSGALAPLDHDRLQQWIRRDWIRPSREGSVPDVDRTRAMRQLLRMTARYVIVRAGVDPELKGVVAGFDRSTRFARVPGEFEGDALYERVGAGG